MMLPFVGVDGEGGNLDDGTGFVSHHYTMLRVGSEWIRGQEPTEEPDPGRWLRFLTTRERRKIYVAYGFDYDVTMMLRDLPMHMLRVITSGQAQRWGGFEISYRPRKELVVKDLYTRRQVTINDVISFFQSSFITACKRWSIGTPEELEMIGDGKEERANFGPLTPETIQYNHLEVLLLQDLMEKFRRTCEIIGYLPTRWQGPGQLAKAMFRKHGIPQTKDLPDPPVGVWEMAQAAYYGGRFETSAVGPIRGPVEGWDINSAYPYACTLLPCLQHGQWVPARMRGMDLAALPTPTMLKVTFTHAKSNQMWYGLPVRTSTGAIVWPRSGSGWYWVDELRSAQALGARLTVHHGWTWHQSCTDQPFDFMHRLYSIRRGIGKSDAGIALKLAMNSAYGITAQSIGKAPYANPVWAGLITSLTRARLNTVLASDPFSVYMLATDGLYSAPRTDLVGDDSLGGWERTSYPDGMHIVQPGVYFAGDSSPKTRGVPHTAIVRDRDKLIGAWNGLASAKHSVDLRQFVGLRLGVHRNSEETTGQWLPVTKDISYDWSTKRRPGTVRRTHNGLRTLPYPGDADTWTVPYDRIIGGNLARNMERLEWADTPDWAETLTEVL